MATTAVRNPRITLNIIPRDQRVGTEAHRALIVGQRTSAGSAVAGPVFDLPRTAAEINALFGARSHAALLARRFRKANPYTSCDVRLLEDAGGAVKATAIIAYAGAATEARTVTYRIVSGNDHAYVVDAVVGDTPATLLGKLLTLVSADPNAPFTGTYAANALTLTAANGGKVSNNWPLSVDTEIPGLDLTLTGWTGGATDPTLTTVFDFAENIRYQTVIWPSAYPQANLKAFLDPRKNLDNDIKDGRGFVFSHSALATLKTESIALNSSEIVIVSNETPTDAKWKGCYFPEAGDLIATTFAAERALRFEDGKSINHIVANNEYSEQFGGMDKCALPYFNTPILFCGQPLRGAGFSQPEQLELESVGVSILGRNERNTSVIAGVMVTTWQTDVAGNDDDTWKYLEWRDTHGTIREYFVANFRKEFSQHRMTTGVGVPGYAFVDEPTMRAFGLSLYDDLAAIGITVKGQAARAKFEAAQSIVLKPDKRRVEYNADVPMVSQFGEMIGSIKFNFATA